MVRLVPQGVTKHLADARKLVLPVERQNHAEQAVKLRAFHALAKHEDIAGQQLLVGHHGQIQVPAQIARDAGDELVLAHDRRHVLEHRLALVGIDPQGGDHVEERIRVDVLLMGVAAQHQL